MNYKILYHGSYTKIDKPNLEKGRIDVDFGLGFYTTESELIAKKWACKYNQSCVNEYSFDMSSLKVKYLGLDKEWLNVVKTFRRGEEYAFDEKYDIIIGPIADDKLFTTLDMYDMGLLSTEQAVQIMNCMNYGMQTVFKTAKALEMLTFSGFKIYKGAEKQHFRDLFASDSIEASKRTMEMIKGMRR